MAIIPIGQKFHTIASNVQTVERGSSLVNAQKNIYTMQDISDSLSVLQSITVTSASQNVNALNGNITALLMQSSTTVTLSNFAVGVYILKITQGGSGSYTITWPASVKWSGGTTPTLTTTVGKTDVITLFYDGVNFYGAVSLNY